MKFTEMPYTRPDLGALRTEYQAVVRRIREAAPPEPPTPTGSWTM